MASGLETMFRKARSAEKRGDAAEARRLLEEVLKSYPKNVTARQELARLDRGAATPAAAEIDRLVAAHKRSDHAETIRLGEALLARMPQMDGIATLVGAAQLARKDYAGAERSFRAEVAAHPEVSGHHNHLGVALIGLMRHDEARAVLGEALRLEPDNVDAHRNMALLLDGQNDLKAGIDAALAALRVEPDHAGTLYRLASLYHRSNLRVEATEAYLKVLALDPEHGGALYGMGRLLLEAGRHEQAVDSLRLAVRLDPDNANIHTDLGQALDAAGKREQAIVALATAVGLAPTHYGAWARMLSLQAYLCDWSARHAMAVLPIQTDLPVPPFAALPFEDAPERQLERSRVYASCLPASLNPPFAPPPRGSRSKIRIGYLSADFYMHATVHLIAGLFREHDRSRFEIYVYDFSPTSGAAGASARIAGQVDAFVDIRRMSDQDAVTRIREDALDIAIDLKGYTGDSRAQILIERVAPVQINYLGYPGSLGMPSMDYILGDPVVIPEGSEHFYSEQVIRLPGSYQPNDDQRPIEDWTGDRASLGLPEHGFVFCSFNQGYKIGPREFDIWMRLLREVDGSVLWLMNSGEKATANLRREAEARGVDPSRLVFAPNLVHPQHLGRQRHADLFLDTFFYNAHTTASDALWGGLPVLTLAGRQFSARVAASIVTAVGLPDLVVETEAAYFDKALALARSPDALADVKARLAANRLTQPLFDTVGYTRDIEAAFEAVHQRNLDGLAPGHVSIA